MYSLSFLLNRSLSEFTRLKLLILLEAKLPEFHHIELRLLYSLSMSLQNLWLLRMEFLEALSHQLVSQTVSQVISQSNNLAMTRLAFLSMGRPRLVVASIASTSCLSHSLTCTILIRSCAETFLKKTSKMSLSMLPGSVF